MPHHWSLNLGLWRGSSRYFGYKSLSHDLGLGKVFTGFTLLKMDESYRSDNSSSDPIAQSSYRGSCDPTNIRSRTFVLTCNNWTQENYDHIAGLGAGGRHQWKYALIGKEHGDNGTPHLQCKYTTHI